MPEHGLMNSLYLESPGLLCYISWSLHSPASTGIMQVLFGGREMRSLGPVSVPRLVFILTDWDWCHLPLLHILSNNLIGMNSPHLPLFLPLIDNLIASKILLLQVMLDKHLCKCPLADIILNFLGYADAEFLGLELKLSCTSHHLSHRMSQQSPGKAISFFSSVHHDFHRIC